MKPARRGWPLALCLLTAAPLLAQGKATVRLLLDSQSARPQDDIMAAIELTAPPGWHTYWRNGGDSGEPTVIHWNLPPGVTAGATLWPIPQKETASGLTTFVYPGRVLLLAPIRLGAQLPAGTLTIKAVVSWLECAQLCLPGAANVSAQLQIGSARHPSADAAEIGRWKDRLAKPGDSVEARAWWEDPPAAKERKLTIESRTFGDFDFFPYASAAYQVQGATKIIGPGQIQKTVEKQEGNWPAKIPGLIVVGASDGKGRTGYAVTVPVESSRRAKSSEARAPLAAAPGTAPPAPAGLGWMLISAFIGGLILNVMPCVLPVIALKILGFVNQSREEPGRVRLLGALFALGVVLSFWVLAATVIVVQRAGKLPTWGMLFQDPQFLVAMTALILLVALNLFGVFEVTLSGQAMGAAGMLAAREGKSGAFFNGVLATVLATPCTAPFLGAALGFALFQPWWVVLLVFTMAAAGLAFPYVALSCYPALMRFMPKPGMWMERFKVIMGFPMLATALWLFWLATLHFGSDGVFWFGLFLVLIALSAWMWGEFGQRARRGRAIGKAAAAVVAALAYVFVLEGQFRWRHEPSPAPASGAFEEGGIRWTPWSPQAVEEARAAGHTVLVDFTAKWCLTCQVNKRTGLETEPVRQKLKQMNAVAMIADFTDKDPRIAQELRRYGRAGVPLVVVYPADRSRPALVLPDTFPLAPDLVVKTLDDARG